VCQRAERTTAYYCFLSHRHTQQSLGGMAFISICSTDYLRPVHSLIAVKAVLRPTDHRCPWRWSLWGCGHVFALFGVCAAARTNWLAVQRVPVTLAVAKDIVLVVRKPGLHGRLAPRWFQKGEQHGGQPLIPPPGARTPNAHGGVPNVAVTILPHPRKNERQICAQLRQHLDPHSTCPHRPQGAVRCDATISPPSSSFSSPGSPHTREHKQKWGIGLGCYFTNVRVVPKLLITHTAVEAKSKRR